MTDRVKGFTVTLEIDIREDEIQPLIDAIRCIRYVAHVEPVIVTPEDHMAKMRVRDELRGKFYQFIKENL